MRQGGQPFTGSLLVFGLVNVNAILFLLFTFLIFRHLTKLFVERRARVFGSRLRTRLVLTFVSLALIPTMFMFFIAWQLISGRLEYQWDKLVKDTLEQTMVLGRVFTQGVQEKLQAVSDLSRRQLEAQGAWWSKDKKVLEAGLTAFSRTYHLTSLEIVTAQGEPTAAGEILSPDNQPVPAFPPLDAEDLKDSGFQRQAVAGGVLISLTTPLKALPGPGQPAYLVARQFIPGSLLHQIMEADNQVQKVRYSQRLLRPVRVSHYLTLVIVTLLTVMSAIWLAFYMAREITTPIRQLAEGTLKVAGGDYDFHIDEKSKDEIGFLVSSFNKMTHDLQASRKELAQALAQLRTSLISQEAQKRYMEILLRNVAAGVIGVDPDGKITNINDSAAQIFRATREEVLGQPGRSLLPPGDHQELVDFAAAAQRSGRTMEKRIHLNYPDKTLYLLLKTTALKDDTGRSLGMVTVIEDLTELERAQRQAAWREVARAIAHEVKNPLTPIGPRPSACDGGTGENPRRRQGLRRVHPGHQRPGGRDQKPGERVLPVRQAPPSGPGPHDLNALVRDALTLYQEVQPRVSLTFLPDPALAPVTFDQEQMKRVLLNLVDNALAAIPDTGAVTLSVHGEPEVERVRVEIADTGVGIPEPYKARVFEPYFSTKRGGTGLGLAIVQSIVAEHQGHIRVEDDAPADPRDSVNSLSTRKHTRPLCKQETLNRMGRAEGERRGPPHPALPPQKNLELSEQTMAATIPLVDDEPQILQALSGLLQDEEFEVLTAPDGKPPCAWSGCRPGPGHAGHRAPRPGRPRDS